MAALAAVAVAVFASGGSIASAADRTVSVNGSATLEVPNDAASLSFSVTKERPSRGQALSVVSSKLSAVIAAAQAVQGVGPGDVTTGRISVRRVKGGPKPLFRSSEGIAVILHQADQAGNLVAAAIAAGATGTGGPNYFVGDSGSAYDQALSAAFAQAKAKAAALATEAGGSLGVVLSIVEGGGDSLGQPPVPQAKGVAGCGTSVAPVVVKRCTGAPPPVKPGMTTVTASVQVVFALQ